MGAINRQESAGRGGAWGVWPSTSEREQTPWAHPALGQQSPDQSPPRGRGVADRRHPRGAATQPLPVSQRGPSRVLHRQVKFPTRSTQEPPFRQGVRAALIHVCGWQRGAGLHTASTPAPCPHWHPLPTQPSHPPLPPPPHRWSRARHLSRRLPCAASRAHASRGAAPSLAPSRHSDTLCHRRETVLWAHSV